MKKALLWSALALPILINVKEPALWWIGMSVFAVFVLKKNSVIFIGVTVMVFMDIGLDRALPQINCDRIVEINDSSFIVAAAKGKIIVFTQNIRNYDLLDQVQIETFSPLEITPTTYGFNQAAYYESNRIIGQSDDTHVRVIRKDPLMTFLGSGGLNDDPNFVLISRAVLFQSDPLTDFVTLVSLGLIYTMILKTGSYFLSFLLSETQSVLIMIFLMGIGAALFAYPLSLMRVLITSLLSLIFKSAKNRLIVYVLFFTVYNPSALISIAILYPCLFMILTSFRFKRFSRWNALAYFQIALLHRVSLFLVMIYPWLRRVLMVLIILMWIGFMTPLLNPMIFWLYRLLLNNINIIGKIVLIRGTLNTPIMIVLSGLFLMRKAFKQHLDLVLFVMIFTVPFLSAPWTTQLTLINVEQGDAILLQAPFNTDVILIDTGKDSAYGSLSSFLNAQGINRIDTLIVTHADNDHSGNYSALRDDFHVMRSVMAPIDIDSTWFHLKSLKTTLKAPTDNQASLVYLLQLNGIRFLLMGDADETTEQNLIKQYPDLKVDILKVGHHGSATSTSDLFLSHIQARLALISVGYNRYGHPASSTLHRLNDYSVPVMSTKQEGDITFLFTKRFNFIQTSSLKLKTLKLGF